MFRPFMRRLLVGVAAVPLLSAVVPVAASTTAAASTIRVAGTAVVDKSCPPAPKAGYDDFAPLRMSGSLNGCWYTNIDKSWDLGPPTGLYFEVGREIFVGSINGGKTGTFSTVYSFEAKFDPDAATGREISGQCQHPIVPGSGTDGLKRVTGYLAFVDIVTTTPTSYTYSGFVNLA